MNKILFKPRDKICTYLLNFYDYDEWIKFCLNQETKCIPGQAWFGGAGVSALIRELRQWRTTEELRRVIHNRRQSTDTWNPATQIL